MKRIWAAMALVLSMALNGLASGMLIPKDEGVPPLAVKHQRVDIHIKDGVATARIEQVFKNSTDRDLEAVYVFPLPENASIADFAMYINGKRMSGELVEKDKARSIYEDIVRRLKDPGLLEYMGGNLFRISVYPVPKQGDQKIELTYSQTLAFESGLYSFTYPLKTGERASRTLEDFTVSAQISSATPIKTVYCPSHEVGITRKGDHEAVVGFEQDKALLDRDFVLYYGVSKKDFGLNLLTHAPEGRPGFFMMMLSPGVLPPDGKPIPKDVVLALDTSGSMAGRKIEQARAALEHCVKRLNPEDRFTIIRFSTDVETLHDGLLAVGDDTRQKALDFVKSIEARGGTAIDGALAKALGMGFDPKRPAIVLFLTDGKPTIGESEPEAILRNVAQANTNKGVRVFVFGVGEEVNTVLLDKLAGANGGVSQYVKPEEDIEVKVSSLADKIRDPVLARPRIEVDKLKISKLHPQALPDLFGGEQLVLFGRYEGEGHVAVRLLGEVNGEKREFVYEDTFAGRNPQNDFIPRLWATRRVGYLLEELRLRGENAELKDEVIRLSKEYGIMTPYTSYLVLEDDKAYRERGIPRETEAQPPAAPQPSSRVFARSAVGGKAAEPMSAPADTAAAGPALVPVYSAEEADRLSRAAGSARGERRQLLNGGGAEADAYLRQESGREALELSEAISEYKKSDTTRDHVGAVRYVGQRVFYRIGGRWVDSRYREEMEAQRVTFGSKEYFELLARHPDLKPCFALGQQVTVALDDRHALIVE